MHKRPDQALHTLRAHAPAGTRKHASAVDDAHGAPFCAMKGWHGVQVPLTAARSTLTLTVILNPPSRLHPPRLTLTLGLTGPWRMPRSGHADPAGCPTLALAPGGRRPRGRGRSTRRVLPRVVAARPHAGSALRRVTPATRRLRGPRAGTERESVDATTRYVWVLDAALHTRGRVPARHAPSAVGDAQDAPCCAVWQVRAAWRRGGRSWGAAARAAWTSSVLLQCAAHHVGELPPRQPRALARSLEWPYGGGVVA